MEALHYEGTSDGGVHCHLCHHDCRIGDGKRGICGIRENREGVLYSLIKGRMSSINSDPIEKKPLYHFHPATMALSFGTVGCNFSCAHCHFQNSGMLVRTERLSPALGQTTHMPKYRSKWGAMGTLHRRFTGCNRNIRAKPFKAQGEQYRNLEYFLTYQSNGLPLNGPGARK